MNKTYRHVYKDGIGWVAIAENGSSVSSSKGSATVGTKVEVLKNFFDLRNWVVLNNGFLLKGLFAATLFCGSYTLKAEDLTYQEAITQANGTVVYTDDKGQRRDRFIKSPNGGYANGRNEHFLKIDNKWYKVKDYSDKGVITTANGEQYVIPTGTLNAYLYDDNYNPHTVTGALTKKEKTPLFFDIRETISKTNSNRLVQFDPNDGKWYIYNSFGEKLFLARKSESSTYYGLHKYSELKKDGNGKPIVDEKGYYILLNSGSLSATEVIKTKTFDEVKSGLIEGKDGLDFNIVPQRLSLVGKDGKSTTSQKYTQDDKTSGKIPDGRKVGDNKNGTIRLGNVAKAELDDEAVNLGQLNERLKNLNTGTGKVPYVSIKSSQIGSGSNYNNDGAKGADSIAIGPNAQAKAQNVVAIGESAGKTTLSNGAGSVFIGKNAGINSNIIDPQGAKNWGSVYIGQDAGNGSKGDGNLYLGSNTGFQHNGSQNIFLGDGARNLKDGDNVQDAYTQGNRNIAIGSQYVHNPAKVNTNSNAINDTIIIGTGTRASANRAIAIGSAYGYENQGKDYIATVANKENSIALGSGILVNSKNSVAIGFRSGISDEKVTDAVALGSYSQATTKALDTNTKNVYLGDNAEVAKTVANTKGAISVGSEKDGLDEKGNKVKSFTRQITNLAAGTKDTDAVNVAQLKSGIKNVVKYDNDTNDKITLGGLDNANPKVAGGVTITNLKAGTVSEDSKDAINGSQLYATNENITKNTSKITKNEGDITTINQKLGDFDKNSLFKVSNNGNNKQNIGLNGEIKFNAGDNIELTVANDPKGANVEYKLKKDLTGVTSIETNSKKYTFGDTTLGDTSVITNKDLTDKGYVTADTQKTTSVSTDTNSGINVVSKAIGNNTDYKLSLDANKVKDIAGTTNLTADLANKADKDAGNLESDDVTKWQEKLKINNKADKTDLTNLAKTDLSNITNDGETKIKTLAKGLVEVKAADSQDIVEVAKKSTTDKDTYTVSVNADKLAKNNTFINSLGDKFAKKDASNIEKDKWERALGLGDYVKSVNSTDNFIKVDNTNKQNPKLSLDTEKLAGDKTFVTKIAENNDFTTKLGDTFVTKTNLEKGYTKLDGTNLFKDNTLNELNPNFKKDNWKKALGVTDDNIKTLAQDAVVVVGGTNTTVEADNSVAGKTTYKVNVKLDEYAKTTDIDKKLENSKIHYVSIKSDNKDAGSNYNNDGAKGADSVAIGPNTTATDINATAIGNNASAQKSNSLAMGTNATALGHSAVAIGENAKAESGANISIGKGAFSKGASSIAIGQNSKSEDYSIAIGDGAEAKNFHSVAIGDAAKAHKTRSVAVGFGAETFGEHGVSVGRSAESGYNSVAIGDMAKADKNNGFAVAVGSDTKSSYLSTAVGHKANAEGKYSTALGANTIARGRASNAFGSYANASGDFSTAIGSSATAKESGSLALGVGSQANVGNSVALGSSSIADVEAGKDGKYFGAGENADKDSAAWKGTAGAVSVGGKINTQGQEVHLTRQITNVAAGTEDTDAVNVAQLKSLRNYTDKGLNFIGNSKDTVINRKLGDTLRISGGQEITANVKKDDFTIGKNIGVFANDDGNLTVALAKNLTDLESVTIKDGADNKVTLTKDGLTIKDGPSVTDKGIDAGNKKITNLVDGENEKDAVNKKQLDEVKTIANNSKTLADKGLKFAANTGAEHTAALGSIISIKGDASNNDFNKFNTKNIMTSIDTNGNISVGLAKDLTNINSITTENKGGLTITAGDDKKYTFGDATLVDTSVITNKELIDKGYVTAATQKTTSVSSDANSGIKVEKDQTTGTTNTDYKLSLDGDKIKDLAGTTDLTDELDKKANLDASNLTDDANKNKWKEALGIKNLNTSSLFTAKADKSTDGVTIGANGELKFFGDENVIASSDINGIKYSLSKTLTNINSITTENNGDLVINAGGKKYTFDNGDNPDEGTNVVTNEKLGDKVTNVVGASKFAIKGDNNTKGDVTLKNGLSVVGETDSGITTKAEDGKFTLSLDANKVKEIAGTTKLTADLANKADKDAKNLESDDVTKWQEKLKINDKADKSDLTNLMTKINNGNFTSLKVSANGGTPDEIKANEIIDFSGDNGINVNYDPTKNKFTFSADSSVIGGALSNKYAMLDGSNLKATQGFKQDAWREALGLTNDNIANIFKAGKDISINKDGNQYTIAYTGTGGGTGGVSETEVEKIIKKYIGGNNIGSSEGSSDDIVTHNVKEQQTTKNKNIIAAINKINKEGIGFVHINGGDIAPNANGISVNDSSAKGKNAIAIGPKSQANGDNTIAIGVGNIVNGKNSGAIGDPSTINANNSYSLGNNNKIKIGADGSFIVGNNVTIEENAKSSLALGENTKVSVASGVALGSGSVANRTTNLGGYIPAGATADQEKAIKETSKGNLGVVSVGETSADGKTVIASRQITGVAAGTQDSDAVNVAQLKAVQKVASQGSKWIAADNRKFDKNGKIVDNNIQAEAKGVNSVAIGAGSNTKVVSNGRVVERPNTVSVGGLNKDGTVTQRTISNVAPGVLDSDAATMGQLRAGLSDVYGKLGEYKKQSSAGTASAMAIGNMPQATIPGKGMVSIGSGFYDGQSAMAIGLSKMSDDGKWVFKGSASYDSQEKAGAALSVGFHF